MKRVSIIALLITSYFPLSNVARAADDNTARQIALSVVSLLLDGDMQGTVQYFHPDAESKTAGKGSAIAKLKKQRSDMFEKVNLENIVFFKQADLAKLKDDYPDNMWQRVSQRIDDQFGCLIVVGIPNRKEKGMLLLLFGEQDGLPRIVYTDDN